MLFSSGKWGCTQKFRVDCGVKTRREGPLPRWLDNRGSQAGILRAIPLHFRAIVPVIPGIFINRTRVSERIRRNFQTVKGGTSDISKDTRSEVLLKDLTFEDGGGVGGGWARQDY